MNLRLVHQRLCGRTSSVLYSWRMFFTAPQVRLPHLNRLNAHYGIYDHDHHRHHDHQTMTTNITITTMITVTRPTCHIYPPLSTWPASSCTCPWANVADRSHNQARIKLPRLEDWRSLGADLPECALQWETNHAMGAGPALPARNPSYV